MDSDVHESALLGIRYLNKSTRIGDISIQGLSLDADCLLYEQLLEHYEMLYFYIPQIIHAYDRGYIIQ